MSFHKGWRVHPEIGARIAHFFERAGLGKENFHVKSKCGIQRVARDESALFHPGASPRCKQCVRALP